MDVESIFREQAQHSPHVRFVFDLQLQRLQFVNAAYERVLGGTAAHANQELPRLLARLHPDDRAYLLAYWLRWSQGERVEEVEFRLLQADGQGEQWLQLTPASGPADAALPLWLGGELRDITAQKRYKAHADSFNGRKNTLLEILSLELADAQRLAQDLGQEAPPPLRTGLQHLTALGQAGVQRIRRFVDEEMQVSAGVALSLERVELGQKLEQALTDYFNPERAPAHRLTLHLPAGPVYVLLDVNKFLQLVTNLLSNAAKFTPDGGQFQLTVNTRGGVVRLALADNGIGIPARWHARLFEQPSPAQRPGLRGEPGSGLGLGLCQRIVELHQGTIRVVSTEEQGTTVIVELPTLPA